MVIVLLHKLVAFGEMLFDEILACLRIWEVYLDDKLAALVGINMGHRGTSGGEYLSEDASGDVLDDPVPELIEIILDGS